MSANTPGERRKSPPHAPGDPSIPETRLVGRARELDALLQRCDAAVSGAGGTVHVTGERGIGKTALVEELAAVLNGRGLPSCWVRATVHAAHPSLIERLVRVLSTDGRTGRAAGDPPTARSRLPETAIRLLRRRAARLPLLVVVDDAERADVDDLDSLSEIASDIGGARV